MKNLLKITAFVFVMILQFSCKSVKEIAPKTATIIVPAKGEIKLFKNSEHSSFSINLTNKSTKNSCEAFTVKNDYKKWISPSLLANKDLDFSVSSDSYVLLENYSNENISVIYTIN
jgi:hypothetical protein